MISTLIVDDDFRVADIHASYVRRVDGFAVGGKAHTAAAAWQAIVAQQPDLILLDLYLPDEHGLALMRRVLERRPPQPDFIAITAARDIANVRAAMRLGAVNYLVKPFTFAQLRDRLAAYRQLRQRLERVREADQEEVDALYSLSHATVVTGQPPKGQSSVTLNHILGALRSTDTDLSAAQIANAVGVSRPTAHRYLSHLIRQGVVELDLNYGSGGRPEHRYRLTI